MGRFRRKADEVDAVRWTNPSQTLPPWLRALFERGQASYQGGDRPYLSIATPEAHTFRIYIGDWILRHKDESITAMQNIDFMRDFDFLLTTGDDSA